MIHFFGWDNKGLPIRDPEKVPVSFGPETLFTEVHPLAGHKNQIPYELIITLILGIVAKSTIDRLEASLLTQWCSENNIDPREWPAGAIAGRLRRHYAGHSVSVEEIDELIMLLDDIAGAPDTRIRYPRRIPFSAPAPNVVIPGKEFVLAGQFVSSLEACYDELWQQGASCAPAISRRMDYLVIGAIRSQEWALGATGAAIQKTRALRTERSTGPAIISEKHLLEALHAQKRTAPHARIPLTIV